MSLLARLAEAFAAASPMNDGRQLGDLSMAAWPIVRVSTMKIATRDDAMEAAKRDPEEFAKRMAMSAMRLSVGMQPTIPWPIMRDWLDACAEVLAQDQPKDKPE